MEVSLYRKILNDGNFIGVRREFIKTLGPSYAILLSELIKKENDLASSHMLSDEGFFYFLSMDIQEDIGYSSDKISSHIKSFETMGILETVRRGQPPRNWYKLDYNRIIQLITACEQEDEEIRQELAGDNSVAWVSWNTAHPEDPIYPGSGYCIHHIDFDRDNNNVTNLQKLTLSEHLQTHIRFRKSRDSNSGKVGIGTT